MTSAKLTTRLRAVATALTAGLLLSAGLAACGGASSDTDATATSTAKDSMSASPSDAMSDHEMTDDMSDDMSKDASAGEAEMAPGAYVKWADYEADPAAYADGKVVLFFHASWCPTCQASEESLNTEGVPDGLTVVKVDFDTATDLRKKYDVTVQHTYVQIDGDGMGLKKWSGTVSGADIAAETV